MRVRVRGIYSTAVTKILLDRGFVITLPSETIAERFGIPIMLDPPDVTVKSDEIDPTRLVIIGFPEAAERVTRTLRGVLKYSGLVRSRLGLNALVVGVYDGKYVDLGGIKATLESRARVPEGEKRVFRVISPPTNVSDFVRVSPDPGIVGKYARVIKSRRPPSVSRHISEEKKRSLLELAKEIPRGFTVHRRSAAEYAKPEALLEEAKRLALELDKILRKAADADVGEVLYPGESLYVFNVSSYDRYVLDGIRDKVVPTIRGHHARKSASADVKEDLSPAVEVLEEAISVGVDREKLSEAMRRYALRPGRIRIVHARPDGSRITLKGTLVSRDPIEIHRTIAPGGKYDGLGIEKSEGDYAITRVYDRYVIHEYYSKEGVLKGIYANVNTPPEFLPGVIRYTDLYVDVVALPGEEPRIVDADELDERYERGLVSEELREKALEVAKKLVGIVRSPRCFLPRTPRAPPGRSSVLEKS